MNAVDSSPCAARPPQRSSEGEDFLLERRALEKKGKLFEKGFGRALTPA